MLCFNSREVKTFVGCLLASDKNMNDQEKNNLFEEKILPILHYVGFIGAVIMSVAYIVLVVVMIMGFKEEKTLKTTIFAIVSAEVGFLILQCFKMQGQSFAENKPENKDLLNKYFGTKTKDKKAHSMVYFWLTSGLTDFLTKAATLALSSIGLIYLIIEGSKDYMLIVLAIVNLLMFICFGILGLVKTYNYFNRVYVEYIKEKLEESKEDPEYGREKTLS